MSDSLATYLHDHLAASNFAIELLGSLRDRSSGDDVGHVASALLPEIEADREQLRQIIDQIGKASADLKELAGWLTEKVSRFKLRHDSGGLATYEAIETISLGILGKIALWRALAVVAERDDRLRGVDFEKLIARGETQHSLAEQTRLQLARTAFLRD